MKRGKEGKGREVGDKKIILYPKLLCQLQYVYDLIRAILFYHKQCGPCSFFITNKADPGHRFIPKKDTGNSFSQNKADSKSFLSLNADPGLF